MSSSSFVDRKLTISSVRTRTATSDPQIGGWDLRVSCRAYLLEMVMVTATPGEYADSRSTTRDGSILPGTVNSRDHQLRAAISDRSPPCGSGAGWPAAFHRTDGRIARRASSAPPRGRRGRDSRGVAAARTPQHCTPGTSRSCAHRDTCCTVGVRRASRQAGSDDHADRTAAAGPLISRRCSGPARRLPASKPQRMHRNSRGGVKTTQHSGRDL
jgi:hypothetical protein